MLDANISALLDAVHGHAIFDVHSPGPRRRRPKLAAPPAPPPPASMTVQVRYYTDPACPRSWAREPELRRLMWEFGDGLGFTWVMGGLARRYGPEYRDEQAGIGGTEPVADQMADWLRVGAASGMPIDPRLWREGPIGSTYPACQAVKAATEQGPGRAYAYLRRLREGLMLERRKLDHAEALVAEAGAAGLDVARFRIDLNSNAIIEAFAADLEEVRSIPGEAREAGAAVRTEGRERLAFPSAVFVSEDGSRHAVWGGGPYAAYREAAVASGAAPVAEPPADARQVVQRFGRVATREVEVVCGKARPLVESELWAAASEWRLRPVPELTGTMWEPA
jgi:predicted DsbA family dithiol-disulfide isomerase